MLFYKKLLYISSRLFKAWFALDKVNPPFKTLSYCISKCSFASKITNENVYGYRKGLWETIFNFYKHCRKIWFQIYVHPGSNFCQLTERNNPPISPNVLVCPNNIFHDYITYIWQMRKCKATLQTGLEFIVCCMLVVT